MRTDTAALVAVLVLASPGGTLSAKQTPFAVGQRWEYQARPEDPGSTLVIVKHDKEDGGIVFVTVHQIRINEESATLSLVPMTEKALQRSVTGLVGEAEKTTYLKSQYADWKNVPIFFDVTVSEVVERLVEQRRPSSSTERTDVAKPVEGQGGNEAADRQERYNEAIRLSNAGKLAESIEAFDALLLDCIDEIRCEGLRHTRDEIQSVLDRTRQSERFNEAVRLANNGQTQSAIEILKELESTVTDEALLERVRGALKQLVG